MVVGGSVVGQPNRPQCGGLDFVGLLVSVCDDVSELVVGGVDSGVDDGGGGASVGWPLKLLFVPSGTNGGNCSILVPFR